MIDPFKVGDAQSQFAGRGDVSRLAIIQVRVGIPMELVRVVRQSVRIVIPERNRPFLAPFLFDGLQFDAIHRHRVGAKEKGFGFTDEFPI